MYYMICLLDIDIFYIYLIIFYVLYKIFGFVLFEFFENLRLKFRGIRCVSRFVYKRWIFSICYVYGINCDINIIIFSILYELFVRYNKK